MLSLGVHFDKTSSYKTRKYQAKIRLAPSWAKSTSVSVFWTKFDHVNMKMNKSKQKQWY